MDKKRGTERSTERGLNDPQKNDNIEFRKKTMTKWKSNLKSIKSYNVNKKNSSENDRNAY